MTRRVLAAFVVMAAMAGVSHAEATGDANTAALKRFYAEINRGNLGAVEELVAADFVEHEVLPGFPPTREGVKAFFAMMRGAFPDLTMDAEFFMADGDKVAAYLTMKGTHQGEFMGMAATGNKINVKTVDIIRMRNGKAVEHWGVTDGATMMEQLNAGKTK